MPTEEEGACTLPVQGVVAGCRMVAKAGRHYKCLREGCKMASCTAAIDPGGAKRLGGTRYPLQCCVQCLGAGFAMAAGPSQVEQNALEVNVISYSAAISACEKGGLWQQAMFLLFQMGHNDLEADVISYSAAVSSWEKGAR